MVGFAAKCGLWVVLAGVALAWAAAAGHFSPWGSGHAAGGAGFWWRGAVCGLVAVGLVWFLRGLARRVRPGWFLAVCMGVSLGGQCLLIGLSDAGWRPTNDAAIFTRYLDHLAENGEGAESLGALSDQYDYRVWTRRAHPFYLPLRKALGGNFARATMFLQALLSVLPMLFIWRMAVVLFGRNTAAWATILQTVFPFKWIVCLELNHHLLGGLYFTAGLWTMVEFFRVRHGRWGRAGLCAAACGLLPLMKFEGGIDWVYGVSVWGVAVGLLISKKLDWRGAAGALAGLWLLPLVVARAWTSPVLARIDAADLHHLESGAVAFMARGWVPETGGEYAYSHEIIDCLTPRELKPGVQKRLLLSQLAYNAPEVFFRLFPTKLAKYFLVGFASGAEEMLSVNGASGWVETAKGARVLFLLVFLPLVAWGGLAWLPKAGQRRFWPFLVPCVLLAAAYVCTGETSPRYSIYIQALLFVMAGCGSARLEAGRGLPGGWAREALPAAGVVAVVYVVAAVVGILVAAPRLGAVSCLDARNWVGEGEVFARPLARSRKPFVVELKPRTRTDETVWGPLVLPLDGTEERDLIAYAFPGGRRLQHVEVSLATDTGRGAEARKVKLPACIRFEGEGKAGVRMEFSAPFETDAPIMLGYAFGIERGEEKLEAEREAK